MGTLNTGAIGRQPSVTWVVTWSGNSSTFNISCTKNGDGYFSGGGWTAYVGFEGGNSSSVYVSAPIASSSSTATTTASVTVTPPGSGTLYFYTTSYNFTSSGVIPYASRKTVSYTQTRTVTVQDRIGSASGTLLGSGSYSVNYGASVSGSSLRSTTYTGYTYAGDSGTWGITSDSTLYRYFKANSYEIIYRNADTKGEIGNFPANSSVLYGGNISSLTPTNSYVITLNINDGSGGVGKVTASRPFLKWTTEANGSGASFSPGSEYKYAANAILYAQWGAVPSVTLPTPTRPGYGFLGWASNPTAQSGISGAYTPSGSITLYAIWKVNGAVHIPIGGEEHAALAWIYHSNKWRRGVPKEYTSAGGVLKYHTCG